jgi:DNA-binding response OmpR family regulator
MSRSSDLDLIVLDLALPTVTGEEILTTLRAAGSSVPVIIFTSSDGVPDPVAILNAGADDYVTRPCSFSELLARIRARLRAADKTVSTTISHGRVTIDVSTRDVRIGGRSVDLTPREFTLLETLMRHAGQVLSQAQLLDQVWGYDRDPSSNVVEVYVGYLRKKLRRDVVETIRGAGIGSAAEICARSFACPFGATPAFVTSLVAFPEVLPHHAVREKGGGPCRNSSRPSR